MLGGLRPRIASELKPFTVESQWRTCLIDNAQTIAAAKVEDAVATDELRRMYVPHHFSLLGQLLVNPQKLAGHPRAELWFGSGSGCMNN
jgi:hypothetical protein